MAEAYELIPGRYGYSMQRTGPAAVAGRVPCEPSLLDGDGALGTAAVLMAIDMTCGMAGGLGVLPQWTVTADTDVHIVDACRSGPLRVDARNVRAGRTMSVVEARAVDEGAGDALVAVATANHGVLESSFEHRLATADEGQVLTFPRPDFAADQPVDDYFGLVVDAAAGSATHAITVEAPLEPRTTNPWGIFHGGLHGLLVERAARLGGLETIAHVGIRFLNAVRVGPAVATVTDSIATGASTIVRIEVRDRGTDRLAVIAHVTGR